MPPGRRCAVSVRRGWRGYGNTRARWALELLSSRDVSAQPYLLAAGFVCGRFGTGQSQVRPAPDRVTAPVSQPRVAKNLAEILAQTVGEFGHADIRASQSGERSHLTSLDSARDDRIEIGQIRA